MQGRGYMHWVLKDEQEFARPGRQTELAQGQGQAAPYPEAGGWEAGSLGKRRSVGWEYRLQVPREPGSSRPCGGSGLGGAGDPGGSGMLQHGASLFPHPQQIPPL